MNINQNTNFGTHNTSIRPGKIEYVVIHYVGATGDAKANVNYYNQPTTTNASADFFVGFAGDIWQYNPDPEKRYCWAVGGSKLSTGGGSLYGIAKNVNCVSIEMCVRNNGSKADTSKDWYFEDATVNSAIELTKYLMKLYEIPANHVIRHYDVTGKNCLPLCTELYTPEGWKQLKDIEVGNSVLQYIPELNICEFTSVLNKVPPYKTRTYKTSDFEATSDHRAIYWTERRTKAEEFLVSKWIDIFNGTTTKKIKSEWKSNNRDLNLSDDELRFLIWIQADGHYENEYGITFHFKKERKIKTVCELLERLGYRYKAYNNSDGTVKINVNNEILNIYEPEFLNNKSFSLSLINMSDRQFLVFKNEITKADGHTKNDCGYYYSMNKENADIVQMIFSSHGCRCNIRKDNHGLYWVSFLNSTRGVTSNMERSVKKDVSVSCVSVKSGFIAVRQDGVITITGNCPNPYVYNHTDHTWEEFKTALVAEPVKKSGWIQEVGGWRFYLGNIGQPIQNNWLFDNDKWYWFNGAGIMVTNTWYQYNQAWYYLGPDGAMCTSQLVANSGKIYAVDADGKMVTGEILLSTLSDGALIYKGLVK